MTVENGASGVTIIDADKLRFYNRLGDDPVYFHRALWADRGLDRHAPIDDTEADMVSFIAGAATEHDPEPDPHRIILGPRSLGKTYRLTAECLRRLYTDPETKVVYISKSLDHAMKALNLARQWIAACFFLQHLQPSREHIDARKMFYVGPAQLDHAFASFTAIGIDGSLPGLRAHFLAFDDIETPKNTLTLDARTRLYNDTDEFDKIAAYGKREIVGIGTYHHEESVYIKLGRDFQVRTYPLCYPALDDKIVGLAPIIERRLESGEARHTTGGEYVDRNYPDNAVFAPRSNGLFSPQDIQRKQLKGKSSFFRQYMLVANASDNRYPLRLADLIVHDVPLEHSPLSITWGRSTNKGSTKLPIQCLGFHDDALYSPIRVDDQFARYSQTVAYIDIAGKGEDEAVMAIASELNGYVWTHAVLGWPGGMEEHELEAMASAARRYRVRRLGYESNADPTGAWAKTFAPLLRRFFCKANETPYTPEGDSPIPPIPGGWSCSLEDFHASRMKEERIVTTLEPLTSVHRLIVDPSVVLPRAPDSPDPDDDDWITYDFQYQFARIRKERHCLHHEDRIDALSGAIGMLMHTLDKDPEVQAQHERDRRLDEILRHDRALGRPRPRQTSVIMKW